MTLSEQLRKLQGDKSQAQLAKEIGISQLLLSRILQDKDGALTDDTWEKIEAFIKRNEPNRSVKRQSLFDALGSIDSSIFKPKA